MVVEVSRRELKKELTRQALLTAAKRLFADKGYDETTIDDIVDQADVAKVTFYYYFKSKEEVVLAIKAGITDQSVDLAQALLTAATSAEAVIRALAGEMAGWVENYPSLFKVFFQQRFSPLMADKQPGPIGACTASSTTTRGPAAPGGNALSAGITPSKCNAPPAGNTPHAGKTDTAVSANGRASANVDNRQPEPAGPPPRLLDLVESIVIKGQQTGEFRRDFASRELGHFILSNLMHEQFMWMSDDNHDTLAIRMDRRVDLLLGGLTPALQSKSK